MAYTFKKYGTFTGPGTDIEYRDNDDFSVEPFEGYFNLNDVSMVLVNTSESPADYVYMHLNGSSTSTVTLERSTGPIPTFRVEADITRFSGDVRADGEVRSNGGAHTLSNKKNFDIPHPNKPGWRLRHTCLEGPENAVYYRGRLTGKNVIELPEYWRSFVDPESITVSLTQIGCSQDLIVDKIEWGSKIIIRSGTSTNIDCYYLIHGTRMDGENLIVEYEGQTPADYPGDNSEYSVAGYHYDIKGENN
jgi:hypothetical protein